MQWGYLLLLFQLGRVATYTLLGAGLGALIGSVALLSESLLPLLRRFCPEGLDALVLTHPDADHLGGAPTLLRRFPVRQVSGNGEWRANRLNEELRRLSGEYRLHAGEVQLETDEVALALVHGDESNAAEHSGGVRVPPRRDRCRHERIAVSARSLAPQRAVQRSC